MLGRIVRIIIAFKFIFFGIQSVLAAEFRELLNQLNQHQLVEAELSQAKSVRELSRKEGSWGDPMLNVAAVNFPRETLNQDASMMTGIRFGVTQSFSLSGRYGAMEDSIDELANSKKASGIQLKRSLARSIWELAAEKKRLLEIDKILNENLSWIKSNLKVTNRLYSTGKVPQQAVLDIQMRKSQLESDIGNIKYSLSVMGSEVERLLGQEEDKKQLDLDLKTVPWQYLESWQKTKSHKDFEEKALSHRLKASDLKVSAKNRGFIPDVSVGVNYTKRNNIDGLGDFVGASISIPIPTSSKRYADKSQALMEKVAAQKRLRHYQVSKKRILSKVEYEILDFQNQLNILDKKTLKYAKSSRDIIARSYARGGADYLELLRSELQFQNQRVKKVNLEASLKKKKVTYLFLKGDDLLLGKEK